MESDTPTFELMNELIGSHGLSEDFLWAVIGSSPSLMYAAFTGHVEYLGTTLERLQRVQQVCQMLSNDKSVEVTMRDFLEEQVLVMDTDNGPEYKRAGEFIANGAITADDVLFYARETTKADITNSQELLPLLGKPSSPSKYHPILRAVSAEDFEQ